MKMLPQQVRNKQMQLPELINKDSLLISFPIPSNNSFKRGIHET